MRNSKHQDDMRIKEFLFLSERYMRDALQIARRSKGSRSDFVEREIILILRSMENVSSCHSLREDEEV